MGTVSNPTLPPANGEARSYADYVGRPHLGELDGVRGVAVILVIAVHAKGEYFLPLSGHLGVMYFFVLSGFLITTLALREERKLGRLSLAAFYVRRTFRIFPLYYLCLALYAALVFVKPDLAEWRGIMREYWPGYVLYYQEFVREWTGGRMPFIQSWTLGIEEKFYLIWPLVGFVVLRGCGTILRAIAVGLGIVGFIAVPLALKDTSWSVLGVCLEPYASLLIGCLLAILLENPRSYAVAARLCPPWLPVTLSAAIVALQFTALPAKENGYEFAFERGFAVVIAVWFAALLIRDGAIQRCLRSRPMAFLGRMSYGMYLIHLIALFPVHWVAAKIPNATAVAWFVWIGGIVASVIGAYILSLTVEQPMIRLGKRLSARILNSNRSP